MRNHILVIAALLACLPIRIFAQTPWTKGTPGFEGQMVHSSRSGANCVTALLNTLSATNRTELPSGIHIFYLAFEGHRGGKDVYTVGIRYPVGRTNEVAVARRVEYEGKRVEVALGKDDTVVVEPRKSAK